MCIRDRHPSRRGRYARECSRWSPSSHSLLGVDAAHKVACFDLDHLRVLGLAIGDPHVAPRAEAAARRRIDEVGRVALDRADHLALLVDVGEGLDEQTRVGVRRVVEDAVSYTHLTLPTIYSV